MLSRCLERGLLCCLLFAVCDHVGDHVARLPIGDFERSGDLGSDRLAAHLDDQVHGYGGEPFADLALGVGAQEWGLAVARSALVARSVLGVRIGRDRFGSGVRGLDDSRLPGNGLVS